MILILTENGKCSEMNIESRNSIPIAIGAKKILLLNNESVTLNIFYRTFFRHAGFDIRNFICYLTCSNRFTFSDKSAKRILKFALRSRWK